MGATSRQLREWLIIALAAGFGVLVALAVGQLILVRFSDSRLNSYAENLLAHSVAVAQASQNVLGEINHPDGAKCSDADLNELRRLSFRLEYLRDIGQVEDGAIICTALWGRLPTPVKLPPPLRRQADGDYLWANAENIAGHDLKVDMVVRGHAIVFTAPIAFKSYERPADGVGGLVLTHDGTYIYRSFGETAGLAACLSYEPRRYDISSNRFVSKCSQAVDICVVVALTGVNIWHQPVLALLGTGTIGALTAGSITLAALQRHRLRASLPQQVKRALTDDRLQVVYQPLVRVRDGHPLGVEALARLSDDSGVPIPPDVFIKIAEESGLIGRITRAVIHKALLDMQGRLKQNGEFVVSINVAVSDILDSSLCDYLNSEVTALGLAPPQVALEITERSTTDHDELAEAMAPFHQRGYRFVIDDFGTGYSNLVYLATLPISGIKIDRMFTQAIGKEAVSSAIVENICAIADKLNVKLVVEGIETEEQAAYIRALHLGAIGQGWLYGKPVPADRLFAGLDTVR